MGQLNFGSTVIVHLAGGTARRVPSPNPPQGPYLDGVAATSPRDAWAVGTTNPARNVFDIQIAYWNGTTWKILTPAPARPQAAGTARAGARTRG